jgi:hypothetical protein
MNSLSFTLQDIIGSLLAFLLFPLVMLLPGYVIGWIFNLFRFRERLLFVRVLFSLVLSISICPILIYLPYRLVSVTLVWLMLIAFVIVFIWLIMLESRSGFSQNKILEPGRLKRYQVWALIIGGMWVVFCILMLADIQLGDRLYFNIIGLDYTTRVAVIDAITRTGVPPVNPGYYPGHPELLTFLYYFWYIVCSLIDQIGGMWVDSRAALIASAAWCGLGLMATIALYLRLRNPGGVRKTWRSAFMGIGLLLISGLDVIPVAIFWVVVRPTSAALWFNGDMEQWNVQVTAWLGAIQWVPNHVAGLIACLTGMMLIQSLKDQESLGRRVVVGILTGLCFASALGLTVWVTLAFVVFWCVWMLVILLEKGRRWQVGVMLFSGVVALLAAVPFLLDLRHSGGASGGGWPVQFIVRQFQPLLPFIYTLPLATQNIINLVILPVNYLFELGFFFMIGLVWYQNRHRLEWRAHPYRRVEVILFITTVGLVTFIRSVVIAGNDFGWRGWMFGQFVLLIWAVDCIPIVWDMASSQVATASRLSTEKGRVKAILLSFLVIGLLTTFVDMFFLRAWPVITDASGEQLRSELSPDTQLGKRTFAARSAYDFIRDNLPRDVIVQNNPGVLLERPSGLYGSRQMVISDHTAYGVSEDQFKALADEVGLIFSNHHFDDWSTIDRLCRKYSIDVVIYNDTDPLWPSLSQLEKQRAPLYQNSYYRVFSCGDFAGLY